MTVPSSDFVVPYAVGVDGWLYSPGQAVKGEEYRCPGCGDRVVPHQGQIVAWHFAHRSNASCSKESVEHRTAIRLSVEAAKRGEFSVLMPSICERCGDVDWANVARVDLSVDDGDDKNIALGNGRFGDAILLSNGVPVVNVEVCYTHPVTEEKKNTMPISWVEINAVEILANVKGPWPTTQGKLFGAMSGATPMVKSCSSCDRADAEAIQRMIAEEWRKIQAEKRAAREAQAKIEREEAERLSTIMKAARIEEERKNAEAWAINREEEAVRWRAWKEKRESELRERRENRELWTLYAADVASRFALLIDKKLDELIDRGLQRFDREAWIGCFLCERFAQHFYGVKDSLGLLRDVDEEAMIWHLENCA